MLIFSDIYSIEKHLDKLKKHGNIIGFVPTMGAFHDGHLSLIKKSLLDNNFTVVSIYVNPTQFDNYEERKRRTQRRMDKENRSFFIDRDKFRIKRAPKIQLFDWKMHE